MSSSIEDNYCNKLETIPQFSGTCWFNSIITVMLYSQGLRRELTKILKRRRKTADDKLFNFILYMLRNYNNIEKLKKVYKEFNNLDLKPEYLLVSYLKKYDPVLLVYIDDIIITKGYYGKYINNILLNYKVPCLFLEFYKQEELYLNEEYSNLGAIIDDYNILIVEHVAEIPSDKVNLKKKESGINNLNNLIKDLDDLKSIITINNTKYKLDSCIIAALNYDNTHVIAGITCNNKKYIIDSADKYKNYSKINSKLYKYNYAVCKPLLYDWDLPSTYCITPKCDIDTNMNDNNFCYNLEESFAVLIYIKYESDSKESKSSSFDESSLISKDFKFNEIEKSIVLKEIYNDVDYYTLNALINVIINYRIYSIDNLNKIEETLISQYCLLYEKLVKKPLKFNNNSYEKKKLLKDIFKALLNKYIYEGLIYNLDEYTDDKTIYKKINQLSLESEDILFDKYESEDIKELIIANTNDIYIFLFITNEAFYDKHIKNNKKNKVNKDKQIIIKLLILKEFFDINYYKEIYAISNKKKTGKKLRSRTLSSI
jgi:hypothetical protein